MGEPKSYVFSGGDVILWIEDGNVMLRARDENGEPVALSLEEAKLLSGALASLAISHPERK